MRLEVDIEKGLANEILVANGTYIRLFTRV